MTRGSGLRVVFDPEIDRGGWPGVLGERAAVVGEVWLGPMGMLGRLEVELGLGGAWASELERAADLARKLRGREGYWSRSFEADPMAVSRRLLADRDALVMAGWEGQPA